MKRIKGILLGGMLAMLWSVACGQTSVPLELQWKVQADDPVSTYIVSTSNNCRGMFLNKTVATGGSLLVASRDNGNFVRRVDPATGQLKLPAVLPGGYPTNALFAINKVLVADDGVIYVLSAGNSGATEHHFRIFRHADEFSEFTTSFDIRTDSAGINARLGDEADIIGSGNNTKILVAGTTGVVWQFTTTDNGLTFTGQAITMNPTVNGTPHFAWDPTTPNRFFWRDASVNKAQAYDITGTTANGASGPGNVLPDATAAPAYGPFDIGLINGVNSVCLGIGASAAGSNGKEVQVRQLSDLMATYFGIGTAFQPGGAKTNGNASGDVYLDSANNALYVLYTNNSVTRFRIPGAGIGTWNQY